MYVEGLPSANVCLVTLLSPKQCSHDVQHIKIVNKTSSFKIKLTGNNAKVSRVNCNNL